MTRTTTLLFMSFILLFTLSTLTILDAQQHDYDYVDDDFVPVSSEVCGNKKVDCIIATFTGTLISIKDPKVGNNITAISGALKNLTQYYHNGGVGFNETINATIVFWGDGNTSAGRALTIVSISDTSNPPPLSERTYTDNGIWITLTTGRYPTAEDLKTALQENKKCSIGAVHYTDYTTVPWTWDWAHFFRVVAIDAQSQTVIDSQGDTHIKTAVLVYDSTYDVLVQTYIDEVNGFTYIFYKGEWIFLEDLACLSYTPPGGGGKGGSGGPPTSGPGNSGGSGGTTGNQYFSCSQGSPNYDPNNPQHVCQDDCTGGDYCDSTSCSCKPLPSCGEWVEEGGITGDPKDPPQQVCKPDNNDCPAGHACDPNTCQCQ